MARQYGVDIDALDGAGCAPRRIVSRAAAPAEESHLVEAPYIKAPDIDDLLRRRPAAIK